MLGVFFVMLRQAPFFLPWLSMIRNSPAAKIRLPYLTANVPHFRFNLTIA